MDKTRHRPGEGVRFSRYISYREPNFFGKFPVKGIKQFTTTVPNELFRPSSSKKKQIRLDKQVRLWAAMIFRRRILVRWTSWFEKFHSVHQISTQPAHQMRFQPCAAVSCSRHSIQVISLLGSDRTRPAPRWSPEVRGQNRTRRRYDPLSPSKPTAATRR